MREFTARLVINETTFAPLIQIVLDDKGTDVTLEIEPQMDFVAKHGEEAEQVLIDKIMDELKDKENLTEEEYTHYRDNFRTLIVPVPK